MCVCICVRVCRGDCESPAQKYLIHWLTDARMCCRRKCWARLIIWIGVVVRNLCSNSATLYVKLKLSICLHKDCFFDSFFD